ncbi:MAG TPA: hypothetical protein VN691_11220 [Steroidobacteraceae bacterium]|nr:hypothetical protein [Steroidobacteraceae bacterium]
MDAKELAAPAGQRNQLEGRRPSPVVPTSGFVDLSTVVPDLVDRTSLQIQMPTGSGILDPVPVCQHHANIVVEEFTQAKRFGGGHA